jgi:8-oxo-dGTP diphosphatase
MPDDVPVFGTRDAGRHYQPRPSAYAVVTNAAGQVAVVHAPRGYYLPGGGIEGSEGPADAARRETREETGLVIDGLAPLGEAIELAPSVDHEGVWYEKASSFFTGRIIAHADGQEADHVLTWMTRADAIASLAPASHRWAVERLDGSPQRAPHHASSHASSHASFVLTPATDHDIPALVALHAATAAELTRRHGEGPWTSSASERGVAHQMRLGRIFVGREAGEIVATLRLGARKPWAIDRSHFTPSRAPLYLTDMAVSPAVQRRGFGRRALDEAQRIARAWPADTIRLDAYDAEAGAGPFYAKCGYREVGRVSYRNVPLIYFETLL